MIRTLSEICISITDCEHKTAPIDHSGQYLSVRTANLSRGKIDSGSCNRVSNEVYLEWTKREVPKKGDIILAREAPVGEVGYVYQDNLFCLGQRTVLIRGNPKLVEPKYLLYKLSSTECKEELIAKATGSVVEHLNVKDIRNYELVIPNDIIEQKAIAEVLSSLDDKIDLLHRQNKTLEEMAETLFRQWFVEEVEGSTVNDEFNVTMGQSPPGNTYNESGVGMIFYQGRTDFGFRFPKPRVYCTHPTRFAEAFDTLMSVRAPVGDINYTIEKCCIGRGVAAIRHKNKEIHHSYTYYMMKHLRSDFDVHEDTGTIFGSINKDQLLSVKCPKLNVKMMSVFNNEIGVLDDKLVANCVQIQQLETLRDTLLPKLMSGVVRVEG